MCDKRNLRHTAMQNRPCHEVPYTILVSSYSASYSGLPVDLASLKTLMLVSRDVGFINPTRMMAVLSRIPLLLLNRCEDLEALKGPSYQPPFRSASLAGIASPGNVCPELGLDLFFLPFLPDCCHPLNCGCALGLSGVC